MKGETGCAPITFGEKPVTRSDNSLVTGADSSKRWPGCDQVRHLSNRPDRWPAPVCEPRPSGGGAYCDRAPFGPHQDTARRVGGARVLSGGFPPGWQREGWAGPKRIPLRRLGDYGLGALAWWGQKPRRHGTSSFPCMTPAPIVWRQTAPPRAQETVERPVTPPAGFRGPESGPLLGKPSAVRPRRPGGGDKAKLGSTPCLGLVRPRRKRAE